MTQEDVGTRSSGFYPWAMPGADFCAAPLTTQGKGSITAISEPIRPCSALYRRAVIREPTIGVL